MFGFVFVFDADFKSSDVASYFFSILCSQFHLIVSPKFHRLYDVRLNHNLSSLVSCRVGRTPCEASWAAAFPAITVSISFCWFCVFYAAKLLELATILPQMDALKIGSFRGCILQKVSQNISPQKLGTKTSLG